MKKLQITFVPAIGEKTINFAYTNETNYMKIARTNVQNLFLLFGMGIPGDSFDLFCKELNLTDKQKTHFRELNNEAWENFNKPQIGWEG